MSEYDAFDAVCITGGPVKSLPGKGPGAFGGLGIIYGSEKETDLVQDYFTERTQVSLREGDTIRTFYRHGVDPITGKTELTRSTFKKQRAGIWFEGKLDLTDPIQRRINNLVIKNKLGFSTGSVSHLVVKERRGNANEILVWSVGELSFTPTPCEKRARVVSLKSLMDGSAAFTETDLDQWEREQEMIADQYLLTVESLYRKKEMTTEQAKQRAAEIYAKTLMTSLRSVTRSVSDY